jgi:hypothetical protein
MKLAQPCKTVQRCLVNARVLIPWMLSTVDRGVVLEVGLESLGLVGDRLSGASSTLAAVADKCRRK